MKIIIGYKDSWVATNLSGKQEEFHNKVRPQVTEFSTSVKDEKGKDKKIYFQYPRRDGVSISTVWGILYRLVGDVRPLYMIKSQDHYLSSLEGKVKFSLENECVREECLTFQNIGNRFNDADKGYADPDHPSSWKGEINETNKLFLEKELYQVLLFPFVCTPQELYDLIVNDKFGVASDLIVLNGRLKILSLISNLNKKERFSMDDVEDANMRQLMISSLKEKIKKVNYKDKDENNYECLVLSAIHLCFAYLCKQYDIVYHEHGMYWECSKHGIVQVEKNKWNKGISPRTLSPKDLLGAIASKVKTSNYPIDENIRENKTKVKVSDGTLIVDLNLSDTESANLKEMIERANIGSFRVGKKGLAYIKDIEL